MGDDNPLHSKNRLSMNNTIVRKAIISLSIIVFIIMILHIYGRCVLRRQARRRVALRQLGLLPTPTPDSDIHPENTPKPGLDPSIIQSLPIFTFTKLAGTTAGDKAAHQECTVCLSMLEEGEMIKLLPNCKHNFHSECIDKWLGSHSTCPICRADAEPRLVLEPEAAAQPTAPPLEGTSAKVGSGSESRLTSFRRMLSRDQSLRQIQEDGLLDIERQ
ncbi:hypothetical protein LguiB_002264 [Lonicera macranthoides]